VGRNNHGPWINNNIQFPLEFYGGEGRKPLKLVDSLKKAIEPITYKAINRKKQGGKTKSLKDVEGGDRALFPFITMENREPSNHFAKSPLWESVRLCIMGSGNMLEINVNERVGELPCFMLPGFNVDWTQIAFVVNLVNNYFRVS